MLLQEVFLEILFELEKIKFMNNIKVFCPASVANVSCGFDVLGFCIGGIGDEILIKKTPNKGLSISRITGAKLSFDPKKNVATIAASAILKKFNLNYGFDFEIRKKIKPGSGIGSSAASASGAVFGINELIGNPYKRKELIKFALEGEKYASKAEHADNIAPALLGGFTLVRSNKTLDIIKLPYPEMLYVTILHPEIELKTAHARSILKKLIPLNDAVKQSGNLAALISALYTNNYDLISRSLKDYIIEPYRSKLIPEFDLLKKTALDSGALGSGISGSGPSIYALSKGKKTAENVGKEMKKILSKLPIKHKVYVSKINRKGVEII